MHTHEGVKRFFHYPFNPIFMTKTHFTKANLLMLYSCYLDTEGNFIWNGDKSIGAHEEMAMDLIKEKYGLDEDGFLDWAMDNRQNYYYEHIESWGWIRYCHWGREHGRFVIEGTPTLAQKAAMKAFCRANEIPLDLVVDKV